MIAFVKGKVYAYGVDWVIIDNNGIGYRIFFGHPESLQLNEEIQIFTYQNVREDELSLFGFLSMEEYDLFTRLISVKGVGPKTAMNMLSATTVTGFVQAIEASDIAFIKSMPGIGAKTASQIILDLKGKLVHDKESKNASNEVQDALDALKNLGYKQNELQGILHSLNEHPGLSSDEYLKMGLQLLMKRKLGG